MFASGTGVSIGSQVVQSDPGRAFYRSIPFYPAVRGPGCAYKIAETCVRVCFDGSQTSFACNAENSSRDRSKKAMSTRQRSLTGEFFSATSRFVGSCETLTNYDKYCRKNNREYLKIFIRLQMMTGIGNFYVRRYDKYQIYSILFDIGNFYWFLILFVSCSSIHMDYFKDLRNVVTASFTNSKFLGTNIGIIVLFLFLFIAFKSVIYFYMSPYYFVFIMFWISLSPSRIFVSDR